MDFFWPIVKYAKILKLVSKKKEIIDICEAITSEFVSEKGLNS